MKRALAVTAATAVLLAATTVPAEARTVTQRYSYVADSGNKQVLIIRCKGQTGNTLVLRAGQKGTLTCKFPKVNGKAGSEVWVAREHRLRAYWLGTRVVNRAPLYWGAQRPLETGGSMGRLRVKVTFENLP